MWPVPVGEMQVYRPKGDLAAPKLLSIWRHKSKLRSFTWQSTITWHWSQLIPRLCGVTDKEYLVPLSSHQRNRRLSSLTSKVRGVRGCDKHTARARWEACEPRHTKPCRWVRGSPHVRIFNAAVHALQSQRTAVALSPVPSAAVVFQAKPSESPFNEVRR